MSQMTLAWRIVAPSGEFIIKHATGYVPPAMRQSMNPVCAALPLQSWTRDRSSGPYRTLLRIYDQGLHKRLPPSPNSRDVLKMLIDINGAIERGTLRAYRVVYDSPAGTPRMGDEMSSQPTEARVAAIAKPCDFEKLLIKCSHCPDDGGLRTIKGITFKRDGNLTVDDLKRPPKHSKRRFVKDLEVVASHKLAGADTVTIELSGGPGYKCHHQHPHIEVFDRATRETTSFKGKTKAEFKATCAVLPPTPTQRDSFIEMIRYYFFPNQGKRTYDINVESCGRKDGGGIGFRSHQYKIVAYPADTYKLSVSIPALGKRSYTRERVRLTEGDKAGTTVDTTTRTQERALSREQSSQSSSTTVDGDSVSYTDKQSYSGAGGGTETSSTETSRVSDQSVTQSDAIEDTPPVDHPAKTIAASFAFERNGQDVKGTDSIGQFINTLVNLQNDIQSTMNFIRDFQPQVGWKFVFELELFKGSVNYEWGYKEYKDHAVYKWWKLSVGLTIIALKLELSFGFSFRAHGIEVTARIVGETSLECALETAGEYDPDDKKKVALSATAKAEPKGTLKVEAVLGADWVKGEAAITCGFPVTATATCSSDKPFGIDWQLDFTGVVAPITGTVKGVWKVEKTFTLIKPKKKWKSGRFPSSDKQKTGVRTKRGAIK